MVSRFLNLIRRHLRSGGQAETFLLSVLCMIMLGAFPSHADTQQCCSDLDARISELENTRAHKARTKLSTKVSGWINMGLMAWDDGVERDAYIVDNTELNSRFRFTGHARLTPNWSAGYRYEFGFSSLGPRGPGLAGSDTVDQRFYGNSDMRINNRIADIWIKNKTLGRLTIGFGIPPSWFVKNWAGRISGTNFVSDSSPQAGMSFFLRQSDGTLATARWRQFVNGRVGPRINRIQWSSPKYHGFQVQAGFGEDDWWDAALYYDSSFRNSPFKTTRVMGALTYKYTDDPVFPVGGPAPFYEIKGSLGALHKPSGFYLWGAAATRNWDDPILDGGYDWYAQFGIKKSFNTLGQTAFFADYGDHTNIRTGFSAESLGFDGATVGDTHGRFFGFGAVQWISAANMELFAFYRHYKLDQLDIMDDNDLLIGDLEGQELQTLFVGARMRF